MERVKKKLYTGYDKVCDLRKVQERKLANMTYMMKKTLF